MASTRPQSAERGDNPGWELDRAEIERRVKELGPWFHNINLKGVQTAPDHYLGDYPGVKWR
ncbi:MAG TPA: hypothetical protein PLQ89_09535, partial [Phycisphaerae bacterium]|nr:hypothetical protein [Phycisphaerae bacterium]